MKNTIPFLLIISLTSFLLLNSCKKDHKSEPGSPPFVETIDGKTWAPYYYKADYFPDWHEIYLQALDNSYILDLAINIDSDNVAKQYLLESNGDNEAHLNKKGDSTYYYSSQDVADAGGTFELTKFDAAKKTISGKFHFIAYTSDKSKKKEVSSVELTDIPCTVPYQPYMKFNGSVASCTVTGVKTTEWHPKEITSKVTCQIDNLKRSLEISVGSILFDRYIDFRIPLEKGTGSYQVYPQLSPYNDCGNRVVTSYYSLEKYNYYPTTGTINITYLDTAQKKLKAEFNVTYHDPVKNNTIQFTNGQINLTTWPFSFY